MKNNFFQEIIFGDTFNGNEQEINGDNREIEEIEVEEIEEVEEKEIQEIEETGEDSP